MSIRFPVPLSVVARYGNRTVSTVNTGGLTVADWLVSVQLPAEGTPDLVVTVRLWNDALNAWIPV